MRTSTSREWFALVVTVGAALTLAVAACSEATFASGPAENEGGTPDASTHKDATSPHADAGKPPSKTDGTAPDAPGPGNDAPGTTPDAGKPADAAKPYDAHLSDGGMAACEAFETAVCNFRSTCTNGFNVAQLYGSAALCESETVPQCEGFLTAPGTGQTVANLENCASVYSSQTCSNFYDNNPIAQCVPPMGTLAMSAACTADTQCGSAFCSVGAYDICGTCQPPPVVGSTCHSQADCGRDLGCATPNGATSGRCAAFVQMGGACLTGVSPCASGLACVGDSPTAQPPIAGSCGTQGTSTGTLCDSTRKTLPSCSETDGLICLDSVGSTGIQTCQSIVLAGAGGKCGSVGSPVTSVIDCEASGLCKKSTPTSAIGTCVAAVDNGQACDNDPTKGPPCLATSKCVVPAGNSGTAGTCTAPNPATCM